MFAPPSVTLPVLDAAAKLNRVATSTFVLDTLLEDTFARPRFVPEAVVNVKRPVPNVIGALFVVLSESVLPVAPVSNVDAAAPVRFNAPSLVTAVPVKVSAAAAMEAPESKIMSAIPADFLSKIFPLCIMFFFFD